MRVHELAKAYDLDSKDVLAIAKRHRIPVKASASANVEDKDVRKLVPHIIKHKDQLKAKEEEERRKKEEERLRKEEERRKKEEERQRLLEEKRKAEEEERRRKEQEARQKAEEEARKRAEEERRRKEEEARLKAEEEQRKAEERQRKIDEERMRSVGLRPPPPSSRPTPSPGIGQQARPARGDRPADQRDHESRPRDQFARGPRPQEGRGPRPFDQRGPRPADQRGPRTPDQRGPRTPDQRGPRPPDQRGPRPHDQRGARPYDPRGRDQRPPHARREEGDELKPVKLTADNLPQIGVKGFDAKPSGRGGESKGPSRSTDRRQGRKKPKPTRIFELDEDMTVTSRPKRTVKTFGAPTPEVGRRRMRGPKPSHRAPHTATVDGEATEHKPRRITIQGEVTVAQFAEKVGVSSTEVIRKLLMLGEMLSLNQPISPDLMEVLGPEFSVELEVIRETDEYDIRNYLVADDPESMKRRPPVVTIMGHVDHGKTTLLDYVRKSNVVEGEFGGITQHIGAYHVTTAKGEIVFLDTPGHEAFTSMRARGASVTDLVILVVAANDGFKPQTIEAIHHAQAAKVPIVVAVNKIDLPGADPARVRQEALQHQLVPEDFGGDTIFVDISAKFGKNVDQLLEMVALQSEILDLKADPDRAAVGTVVESHVDPQRGAVATVLVQKGTLRAGDAFVAGDICGRIRAMVDDHGRPVREAGPSVPAEIIGLTGSPGAGEMFLVVPDEQAAREIASKREIRRRAAGLAPVRKHVTLEGLHEFIEEGKTKELNVILKGDVQGSIEAVSQSLLKLPASQVRIRILHAAVGGVNESDVNLAAASDAVIIGFNVRPEASAAELANQEGVEIKLYRIIYDLIEEVRAAMVGMLEPKYKEIVKGHAEVRQIFRVSRIGTIGGCYVRDGEIVRDSKIRVIRDNIVVYEGNLASLRRVKDDVRRVAFGLECGICVENYNDIKEGDIIEAYEMEQIEATLE